MQENSTRTIEINGIKMEVDLREAKRIDTFRVGDVVRILQKKTQYDGNKVHTGVIVGFEDFKSMPTIVVSYIDAHSYGDPVKVAFINKDSEEQWEIIGYNGPMDSDILPFTYDNILNQLTRAVEDKLAEYSKACDRRDMFIRQFGKLFGETMTGVIHTGAASRNP